MTDLKRSGKNNQKREPRILVVPFVEADILTTGSIYATLPARTLLMYSQMIIKTPSGTASSTLDVTANGNVIANEVAATVATTVVSAITATAAYLPTGGDIVIKAGAVTPANGALVGEYVLTYVELDKTNGEYTN